MKSCGPILLLLLAGCAATPSPANPPPPASDSIRVAGRPFPTGTRVILWDEPGGFDAYRPPRSFGTRKGAPATGYSVAELARTVTQIVVHYDVSGTSRRCFEVLRRRGLSCHFLVDLDGTVYQTLDVAERAWHAAEANDRSVGIEVANIGAWPEPGTPAAWYAPGGGHPPGAPPPARPEMVTGRIQGGTLHQFDFTEPQYRALAALVATLCRVLDVPPKAPRGVGGQVRDRVLAPADAAAFSGIVGHFHVSGRKVDPGPAFQWGRFLADVRARLRGSRD